MLSLMWKGRAGPGGWKTVGQAAAGCVVYLCCLGAVRAGVDEDPLFRLLAGEFALQEGATVEAAEHYSAAAARTDDARLAERAARLALHAGNTGLAATGMRRWRELDADAEGLPVLELALALAEGDQSGARAALDPVLALPQGWKLAIQAVAAEPDSLVARVLVADLLAHEAVLGKLDALLALGGFAERQQMDELADRVAAAAVQRFPEAVRAWLWKADLERQHGDVAAARESVAAALALPEVGEDMRLAAAGLLSALGDPAAAAAALAAGAQSAATWSGRAAFLVRADDDAGMIALYDELRALPPPADADRLYLLGQLAELVEHDAEANDWYRQIPPGDQADQALLRLAILADKREALDEALALLHTLQTRESDDGGLFIDAYLLEAELLEKHQRGEDALDRLSRGLITFEDDARLLYARALLQERLDRLDGAEADLRRILGFDPESAEALNALGYTLADRTDRLQEAHELIGRALAKQPDNPAIIDSMGWVLYRLQRVEEALPHLRRAFELQRDAEVAAHLGAALWAAGQQDEARSIWRLGEEIDPGNRAIARTREALGATP